MIYHKDRYFKETRMVNTESALLWQDESVCLILHRRPILHCRHRLLLASHFQVPQSPVTLKGGKIWPSTFGWLEAYFGEPLPTDITMLFTTNFSGREEWGKPRKEWGRNNKISFAKTYACLITDFITVPHRHSQFVLNKKKDDHFKYFRTKSSTKPYPRTFISIYFPIIRLFCLLTIPSSLLQKVVTPHRFCCWYRNNIGHLLKFLPMWYTKYSDEKDNAIPHTFYWSKCASNSMFTT